MINFGLEGYLGGILYSLAVVLVFYSMFWRPIAGLYVLVPLIPLQTIRYRLQAYPLGGSVAGVILLAVAIGLLLKRRPVLAKTPWNLLLLCFCVFTFVSLCWGYFYLHQPFFAAGNERLAEWREYMIMPSLLFLTAAAVENRRQVTILVALMCLGALALDKSYWSTVSGRDFSEYSDDLRDAGAMGYAGVNGLAAFEAQFGTFVLALAAYEKGRVLRWGYYALGGASILCLMFSLSRGGYAALIVGLLFVGVLKQRKLLPLMLVFGLMWTSLVPKAVQQRVDMTYVRQDGGLDHSSEIRISLWEDAMRVFESNPFFGTGVNTYEYMGNIDGYKDTHNYFVKVLVETGILGLLFFLVLLWRFCWTGLLMYWRAADPLFRALGLGLAGWMVSACIANVFGDRWSFLQVNGYMWVIAGLVARGWIWERDRSGQPAEERLIRQTLFEPQVALS